MLNAEPHQEKEISGDSKGSNRKGTLLLILLLRVKFPMRDNIKRTKDYEDKK